MATVALVVGAVACSSHEDPVDGDACSVTLGKGTQARHQRTVVGRASMDLDDDGANDQHVVLRVDGLLYLDAHTARRSATGFESHVTLGGFFHGMRTEELHSADGMHLDGRIDGKELAPFLKGEPPRFRDGSPLEVTLDEDAKQAVTQLSTGAAPSSCATLTDPGIQPLGSGYPNSGHLSLPQVSPECAACHFTCGAIAGTCVGIAFSACAGVVFPPAYVVCVVAGLVICAGALIGCEAVCLGGAPCCPTACGGGCCFGSETCLDTGAELCCSAGTDACHATDGSGDENCCNTKDVCLPDGSCCPQGRAACDGVCCIPGDLCELVLATGRKQCTPCPSFRQCGFACCGETERCTDPNTGSCCSAQPFFPTCQGHCCNATTDKCTGSNSDECCPDARACGGTCCPATRGCAGANTCANCSPSQALCTPPSGPHRCCDPGSFCDQNGCCAAGQVLCGSPGICTTLPVGAVCP